MDVRPTPNLLWRAFVLIGLGTLTVLSTSDQAWDRFRDATGGAVPRQTVRQLVIGTLGVHAVEGLLAGARARRSGLAHPARWGLSTFLWGFPVLRRLGRARQAVGSAGGAAEVAVAA
jgi:hypothetical protein